MESGFFLLIITLTTLFTASFAQNIYCEDWTICRNIKCASPPDPCPVNQPYLLYGQCGCCKFCSNTPRFGPCGQCGVHVNCTEGQPICNGKNRVVTLDYCGCCRVCKTITGPGSKCQIYGPSFTVCDEGLRCINGTCQPRRLWN